jgi:hypothetical protein
VLVLDPERNAALVDGRAGPMASFARDTARVVAGRRGVDVAVNAIERVVAKWRAEGIEVNPGVSDDVIARLERQVGTTLPDDVRSFFALAAGFEDASSDEYMLSFWSIEKILSEVAQFSESGYGIDPRDTPIADVMINAWFVYLRRLGEGRVGVWLEGPDVEFPSLADFFEQYERDPNALGL